jgi:hypothetical protein
MIVLTEISLRQESYVSKILNLQMMVLTEISMRQGRGS